MSPRNWLRTALVASTIGLPMATGCDIDRHDTATGQPKQPAETEGPTDPGKVKAGGPGSENLPPPPK